MSARGVLQVLERGRVAFWCVGCDEPHEITVEGTKAWGFNGDYLHPTITPSILVTWYTMEPPGWEPNHGPQTRVEHRCHSFVRDGRIEYLSDCSHKLAGQTVPLEPFP